ncbi:MAG: AbrB/MazE/SpoVT family DNA-binding domain-containing protein [Nanoarchaeota archaeon]
MAAEAIVRKWGNSLGIILPKEFVEQKKIKENEKVQIEVVKKANISHLFGSLKTKMTGQQFKDQVREGWE